MTNYKLSISYDGTDFHGFQIQKEKITVQGEFQKALEVFTNDYELNYSGRTDAGVHAMGQVAHFDINNKELEPFVIKNALNDHLRPFPIAILDVDEVDNQFHARFNALQRKYLYRIVNRKSPLTIEKGRAWHVHKDIEVDPMKECISLIEGKHDFTTFRSAHCQ